MLSTAAVDTGFLVAYASTFLLWRLNGILDAFATADLRRPARPSFSEAKDAMTLERM
ncbi:MAG: hypothetical protein M1817_006784 [Caeruleum heppii]|nr:MAG: hypothetical protein M1817_006784 [Caeruleum heppii]